MADFEIRDLRVSVEGREILKGVTLDVDKGQVHAVMGPNGSGKSTLSQALMGHPAYEVTGGQVRYKGVNLLELAPDQRARLGIYLAFQYPNPCATGGGDDDKRRSRFCRQLGGPRDCFAYCAPHAAADEAKVHGGNDDRCRPCI